MGAWCMMYFDTRRGQSARRETTCILHAYTIDWWFQAIAKFFRRYIEGSIKVPFCEMSRVRMILSTSRPRHLPGYMHGHTLDPSLFDTQLPHLCPSDYSTHLAHSTPQHYSCSYTALA